MSNDIELRNENGRIVGYDSDGNKIPVRFENGEFDSVRTDSIETRLFIEDGASDFQSRVENANPGTYIALEPGGSYTYTPPFDIPRSVTIDGGISAENRPWTTITKAGDGQVNVNKGLIMFGVNWEGNSTNYIGDGLVDTGYDQQPHYYLDCRFADHAGSGRVVEGLTRLTSINCWYTNNREYGFKCLGTGTDGFRRSTIARGGISRNDKGGVRLEGSSAISDAVFNARMQNNGGPAFDVAQTNASFEISGNVGVNSGPAVYINDGSCQRLSITGTVAGNADTLSDLSQPITMPVGGAVHVESATGITIAGISNCVWASQSTDTVLSNFDNLPLRVTADGTARLNSNNNIAGSGDTDVILMNRNQQFWDLSNANAGYVIQPGFFGERYIQDLTSGSRWYLGSYSSEPEAASSAPDGSFYIDTSTNPPEIKIKDPADGVWETSG